jgi:hypothetical protein
MRFEMEQKEFLEKAREWQKQHPEWELYCDMKTEAADALYQKFGDLPAKQRMHWVGKYGEKAVEMWEEYGHKRCKVDRMFLNEDMELVSEWPTGQAMTCFKTNSAICVNPEPNER